jgi:hypothetical protein
MNDGAERREQVIDELTSEQRLQRQQIRDDAEVLQSLIKHPGWARYIALLEIAGNNFNKTLMQPLSSALESVRTEYAKGALYGIQGAASLPHAKIREAADLNKKTDGA